MNILHAIYCALLLLFLQSDYRILKNESFQTGENYAFKIKYGFLTVGEASVNVDKEIFLTNNRPCYKVTVVGRTAGMTTLFKVKNTYVSYIDTLAFVPQKFMYSARENSYARDQSMVFSHALLEVTKTEKDQKKTFKVPKNTQDVVSGYYFLRTLNYSSMSMGQIVSAPLFFDEDLYSMKVKYGGKARIGTKFGKINVVKLNPLLPNNQMFKGENAIRIWVTDDANKVPVKIEADFSIGTVIFELKYFNDNRYPFKWS
jgi:hypothetical protein